MFTKRKLILIYGCSLFCHTCGRQGTGKHPSNPPALSDQLTPQVSRVDDQKTKVDFDTLPYKLAIDNDPACLSREDGSNLVDISSLTAKDAGWASLPSVREWPANSKLLSDITGDSEGSYDLSEIAVGVYGSQLVVTWEGNFNSDARFVWEFGYYTSRQDKILRAAKTYILVDQGKVFKRSSDTTTQLTSTQADFFSRGESHFLRISLEELDTVRTYPMWWIRGMVGPAKGPWEMSDSTQIQVFKSSLNPDFELFSTTTCHVNLPPPFDLKVAIVRESASITADATSGHLEEQLFTAYRNFVDFMFLKQKLNPKLRSKLPLFYLSSKELLPVTGLLEGSLGMPATMENNAKIYFGSVISLSQFTSASDSQPELLRIKEFIRVIARHFLISSWIAAPPLLLIPTAEFTFLKWAATYLGKKYWIDHILAQSRPFHNTDRALTQLTFNELEAKVSQESSSPLGITLKKIMEEKATMLAAIFAANMNLQDFWKLWISLDLQADQPPTPREISAPDSVPTFIREAALLFTKSPPPPFPWKTLHGWYSSGTYFPLLNPELLADLDFDGLPNYLEAQLGTDPKNIDSDGDQWSDGAEWVLDCSPISASSAPDFLVADGLFGDWQKLLPRRIHVDRGRSGICAKSADIQLYAALSKKDALMIAAVVEDFWTQGSQAHWEIDIDFAATEKRYLLSVESGGTVIQVDSVTGGQGNIPLTRSLFRTLPIGIGGTQKVLEINLKNTDFNPLVSFRSPESVRLRIRTIFSAAPGALQCDETPWFQPITNAAL
jgi:hypothetical protein